MNPVAIYADDTPSYGGGDVLPRPARCALRERVGRGAVPVILGGDHSIAYATIGGLAAAAGAPRIVQFDAHTDTAAPGPARPLWSHGAPMRRLVEEGIVSGNNHLYQVGLRGWWPGEAEFR